MRFVSNSTARHAGLVYHQIRKLRVQATVSCNAQVGYDAARYARVASLLAGRVESVRVDLGTTVRPGQVLAVVESADLGQAKARCRRLYGTVEAARARLSELQGHYERVNRMEIRLAGLALLQARQDLDVHRKNHEREQGLARHNATSERDLLAARARFLSSQAQVRALTLKLNLFGVSRETLATLTWDNAQGLQGTGTTSQKEVLDARMALREASTALEAARSRLEAFGLSRDEVKAVERGGDRSSLLEVKAPFAGRVVERTAAVGEYAPVGRALLAITNASKMWAMLDVYERDIRNVRIGQTATVVVEGLREAFTGPLTWIASHVDQRTRTLRARAELVNRDGLLRANMFARAWIAVGTGAPAVVVPKQAVQWEGCCNLVFVRRSDRTFEPRKVLLGYETSKVYEVREGLRAGETVVTTGSFLLKTEILKGSIGAGCCGD